MTTIFSVTYSGLELGEKFHNRIMQFTETCPKRCNDMFHNEYTFCMEAKRIIEETFADVTVQSIQPAYGLQ